MTVKNYDTNISFMLALELYNSLAPISAHKVQQCNVSISIHCSISSMAILQQSNGKVLVKILTLQTCTITVCTDRAYKVMHPIFTKQVSCIKIVDICTM